MSPRPRRARRQRQRSARREGAAPAGRETWLGDSRDVLAGLVLLVGLALRAYYFVLTKDQPLWWDEAEYMLKAKAMVFGTPDTGWWVARPVLLTFLAAALFKMGIGETVIRILWVVLSTGTLALVYRIASVLFDKRVGVYAIALASVSYIDVFYTMRLLVDGPPQVFFTTLAIFLAACASATGRGRMMAWGVFPALAVGIGMRFTAAILVPVVILFVLVTRGLAVLKDRTWYISIGLAGVVIVPMLLYFRLQYGDAFAPFFSHMVLRGGLSSGGGILSAPMQIFMEYVQYMPAYTTPVVAALFAAGLIQAGVVLARGWRRRREDPVVKGSLLLVLWVVVPFLFYSFAVNTFQDRFLTVIFPAFFILVGTALDTA